MITEGIELTRGTKKIIQEAIETVDTEHRNNRIALCEEFCRIVENRYTGGAMSYQLKRMGNTYPLDLLSKNGWTIQDALDSGLTIYLSTEWFVEAPLKKHEGDIYKESSIMVEVLKDNKELLSKTTTQLATIPHVTKEDLSDLESFIVSEPTNKETTNTQKFTFWEKVSEKESFNLTEKLYWLKSLTSENQLDNETTYMTDNEILNFSETQSKAKGLLTGRSSSVKIPLESTGPILEAIDKYLYDKTGQYTI